MPSRRSQWAACPILLGGVVCFLMPGSASAACSSSSTAQQLTVDTDTVQTVIDNVSNCSRGDFNVVWEGHVVIPGVFTISDGTALHITGSSASSAENVIDGGSETQLFSVSGGAELTLEGVTITGGLVEADGGAIFADNSTVTLTDCVVVGNAADDGGAVYLLGSRLELLGTTEFANNTAVSGGGAIDASDNSSVIIGTEADVSFVRNVAGDNGDILGTDYGFGGAICLSSSNLTISGKATFSENTGGAGGAVHMREGCSLDISGEVEFHSNRGGEGGAIIAGGDTITLNLGGRINFVNNTATLVDGGALGMKDGGEMSIIGEVNFTENHADGEGGAVAVGYAGTLKLEESAIVRFSENSCNSNGGAMALWNSGGVTVYSSTTIATFVGNSAGGSGGAIFATNVERISVGVWRSPGNVTFVGNNAGTSGGAVRVLIAEVFVLEGLEFRENSARIGGAVVVESSSDITSDSGGALVEEAAKLSKCSFISNTAAEDGGALHVGSGFVSVRNSIFEGNEAGRSGGAVSISGDLSIFENCSFSANKASSGPAVSNIGTISDESPTDLKFTSNSLVCDEEQYIDYSVPSLSDEAVDINVTAKRYMVDCDGCPSWDICSDCEVLGDVREPACSVILDHTTSPEDTGTLETLVLEPGYWRATNISKVILSCFNEEACLGNGTAEGYCAVGYEGPYCSVCEEGYAPGLSFTCNSCSGGEGMMALAIVLVFVIAAVVVAIIFDLAVGSTSPADGHGCGARFTRLKDKVPMDRKPFQTLKIVVVSWQIITQFSEAANAIYPESYERFLAIVGLSNLDLAGFLTARCLISTDFHDRLLFSTLGPIAVLGVLACTYAFATRIRDPGDDESRTTIKSKHASIALLVAFLVYGSVSSTVFGMFACEDLDDGGSYLRGDYSIRCDSGKHRGLMVYAGVMILVYPLGIPALFAWLLYSNRDKLSNRESDGGDEEPTVRPLSNGKTPPVKPLAVGKNPAVESLVKDKDPAVNLLAKDGDPAAKPLPRDKDPTVKPFAELWQPYKPEMYLYELLVYLRRILLTGLVVFIFPNTAAQVAVTFMIELFFFVLSVFLLPYADRVPPTRRPKIWLPHANAWLSHVSHVVVLVSLYLALLLKVDISDETGQSQQVFAGVLIAVHCLMILSVVVQAVLSMNNDVKDSKEETEWPSARETFEDILGTRGPSARELPDPLRKSQRSTASTSATKMDEEKTASEKSPHELESEQRPEAPAEQLVSPAPSS